MAFLLVNNSVILKLNFGNSSMAFFFPVLVCFVVLGVKLRTSSMLSKRSTSDHYVWPSHTSPLCFLSISLNTIDTISLKPCQWYYQQL